MKPSFTLFRRLLPVLLLGSLVLAACESGKDHDPRPKGKGNCGSKTTPPPPTPGGNS